MSASRLSCTLLRFGCEVYHFVEADATILAKELALCIAVRMVTHLLVGSIRLHTSVELILNSDALCKFVLNSIYKVDKFLEHLIKRF